MGAIIQKDIFGLEGQVIKDIVMEEVSGRVRIVCRRDRRRRPVDHRTRRPGSIPRFLRRTVLDVPLFGRPCEVEIEYAETFLSPGHVRVEALPFVAPGARVTRRFARLIAGMARHMPISVVARHTGLSWDSVKAIECAHWMATLEPPRPQTRVGIRYLGVDEVARAQGQSYFTLVYDLTPGERYGRILWVKEGRDSSVLLEFLEALSEECARGIEAVALDMGLAYISAVRKGLPHADLDQLLAQNESLSTLYMLKEQLQRLWQRPATPAEMAARLDDWYGMARAAKITSLNKFVKTLQSHRTGICNYAAHPITTARLEAGNVTSACSGSGPEDYATPSTSS